MSYQRDREEFISVVQAEGMDLQTARLVLRNANVARFANKGDAYAYAKELAERMKQATCVRGIRSKVAYFTINPS